MDEDDHMDDDLDVTRTQQGDDIDLFDEGETSNGDGSHRAKGDNSEASCGPGEGGGGVPSAKCPCGIRRSFY